MPWRSIPAVALGAGLLGLIGCSSESPTPPPVKDVVLTSVPAPPPAAATNAEATIPSPPAPTNAAPVATVPPQPIPLSPAVGGVVEMAQAQVGEALLLEYIKNSTLAFLLDADQIIYLKDIGLSEQVIAAMIQHPQNAQAASALTPAAPAAPPPAPATVNPAEAPAPATPPADAAPAPPAYANASPPPAAPAEQATVYAQPVTQVSHNYFYSALAPYGSWVELPSYGWCWRPTVAVVDVGWRPYCHGGRWLYTDCGWYWQSSYSWGWAPFHYGNWYRSPACGWVWVPGSTWGPAWVTWRYADAYCGWAPLPPGCGWSAGVGLTYYGAGVSVGFSFSLGWDCYSFVSYGNFCDPHPYRHCLPRNEISHAYNRSKAHNDYAHHNQTVVNRGIAPERITAVTRNEVRKVGLRDITNEANAPRRASRFESDSRELAVYRPQPTARPGSAPPPAARRTAEAQAGSPGFMADTVSRAGAPLGTRESRSVNQSAAPSQPAVAPTPAAASPSRSAPASATRAVPTAPRSPAVVRSPSLGSEAANVPPSGPPARVEGRPAARSAAPRAPGTVNRSTTPPATPFPAAAAPNRPSAPPAAPRAANPPSASENRPRSVSNAQAARPSDSVRSQPVKVEAPMPINTPTPKYVPGNAPGSASPRTPGAAPAPPRSSGLAAPSAPAYQPPRSAPAGPPAAAPARPANSAPSAPAYNPPSRAPASAPAPAQAAPAQAPPGGGGNRSAGRGQPQ